MEFHVEHFAALKRGRKEWEKFRQNNQSPSLSGIDLSSEDTAGPFLWDAGRGQANLEGFNLGKAKLDGSNLSRANFAKADLNGASLKECNLSHVKLAEAGLEGADLQGADMSDADLDRAKLSGSSWKGVKLTRTELGWMSFIPEAKLKEEVEAEKEKKNKPRAELYAAAQDGWRRLKNNWLEMGKYDDASKAAVRERRAERKAETCWLKHDCQEMWKQGDFKRWRALISLFITGWGVVVSCVYDWLCDYGENPSRILFWGVGVIAAWMVLYSLGGIEAAGSKEVWRVGFSSLSESLEGFWIFLYFSTTAFTAAGFGDFVPYTHFSRVLAASESLIGLFLSAMFVWTLSRRMSPR